MSPGGETQTPLLHPLPPFTLSAPKYQTPARKEPRNQNNTLSIQDLDGGHNMKYLLTHFKDKVK